MTHTMRRAAASALSLAVLTTATAVPALAGSHDYDGQDRGNVMGMPEAIVVFGILPLGISAVLAGLVLVPDWFRKAKASTRGGFLDDPTLSDREAIDASARAELGR